MSIRVIVVGSFAAFMNFGDFPPATEVWLDDLDLLVTGQPSKRDIKKRLKERYRIDFNDRIRFWLNNSEIPIDVHFGTIQLHSLC